MLNKKRLFALLLVGSLSSGMYAAPSRPPTPDPDNKGAWYSGGIHMADNYLNKINDWTGDWAGTLLAGKIKTKLAVYALIAWMGYESSDRIIEKATQAVESVKRSVGLGSDEECESRSPQCWNSCDK